jgi:uncharacterized protein (TIGR03067 family)
MFAVLAIVPATVRCADAAPLKELNGVWAPDSAVMGGVNMSKDELKAIKLALTDGKYVMTNAIGDDKGEFKVDASTDPKSMDIEGKEGPNKGRKFPCIYKLSGDELTICYDLSGKARPAEFQSKEKTLIFLAVYHRQK